MAQSSHGERENLLTSFNFLRISNKERIPLSRGIIIETVKSHCSASCLTQIHLKQTSLKVLFLFPYALF